MLNELDNDESVLLLYLAGELSAEGRADVDRRLAAEPALRQALTRLEAMHGAVADWFKQADAAVIADDGGRGRSAVAVRRVSRAFVQRRTAEEAAKAAAAKNESMWPKSLLPRWAYPLTAAAAIIVGLLSLVQWGGSLVGGGSRGGWGDMRGEGGPSGPGGYEWRPGGMIRGFANSTYGLDDADFRSMQLSAGGYDVSTMFQPEVD